MLGKHNCGAFFSLFFPDSEGISRCNERFLRLKKSPNQCFLVIESLKSPSRLTSISFKGPIIRFLHIMAPTKQLESCQLEKEGAFLWDILEGVLKGSII